MKQTTRIPNKNFFTRRAKKLRKSQNIKYHKALDLVVQDYGFQNWKHYLKEWNKQKDELGKTDVTGKGKSNSKEKFDPYRNLLACAINKLIESNLIQLDLEDVDDENDDGHVHTELFEHKSVIIWRNIGFGELQISVWFKYDHSQHPLTLKPRYQKEKFNLSMPLARRQQYSNFVGVIVNGWLERKKGQYIQGEKQEGIFDKYTRKGELNYIKNLPQVKPNGFKTTGKFYL